MSLARSPHQIGFELVALERANVALSQRALRVQRGRACRHGGCDLG
jgi:hypothetical protein